MKVFKDTTYDFVPFIVVLDNVTWVGINYNTKRKDSANLVFKFNFEYTLEVEVAIERLEILMSAIYVAMKEN